MKIISKEDVDIIDIDVLDEFNFSNRVLVYTQYSGYKLQAEVITLAFNLDDKTFEIWGSDMLISNGTFEGVMSDLKNQIEYNIKIGIANYYFFNTYDELFITAKENNWNLNN